MRAFLKTIASAWLMIAIQVPALAATATGNFNAQIVIESACVVAATNLLDFGTTGVLSANIDQTTTFEVQCTDTTPYRVGLDAGSGAGATTLIRRMTGATATIDYQMFSEPTRTTNWGDDDGVDTVAGTGNGAAQTLTIYGRVIPQSTPLPDTYVDTVTIEVNY